jgi:hypothetical protein
MVRLHRGSSGVRDLNHFWVKAGHFLQIIIQLSITILGNQPSVGAQA